MNKLLLSIGLLLSLGIVVADEYVVTHTNDPIPQSCTANNCSLREAIIAANNNPGEDIVLLQNENYRLFLNGIDDDSQAGDLDITDDLIIMLSPDSEFETFGIESAVNDRVLDVHPGVSFTMHNGHIKGGDTTSLTASENVGGGLRAREADIYLIDSTFAFNNARTGGGIYIDQGSANLYSTFIAYNIATEVGGGLNVSEGLLHVENSIFQFNQADWGAGLYAGYIPNIINKDTIQIKDSQFLGNQANYGGAICTWGNFGTTMGSILLENTQFIANVASEQGGAIYHYDALMTIRKSNFQNNFAQSKNQLASNYGGAIYSGNPNSPSGYAELHVLDSLFNANGADSSGGGLYANDLVQITNTTFSGNTADTNAAIQMNQGDLSLKHITMINNEAINDVDLAVGITVTGSIQNSIINGRCNVVSFAGFESLGGNIESPADTCELGGGSQDLSNIHPRFLYLDSNLADNGGPTQTHAIRNSSSRAIGNAIAINEVTTDQRLKLRDSMPDSGAVEAYETDFTLIFKNGFEENADE
ncbi:choice-of-anchor Q domain-containing protein [Marinicella sp. W31]|uniref:choice-of-anchor Q domain-containing protein n=1 Tax=Marinicella sp. W31 TaxID=3023713 RepID=UPI0037583DDE